MAALAWFLLDHGSGKAGRRRCRGEGERGGEKEREERRKRDDFKTEQPMVDEASVLKGLYLLGSAACLDSSRTQARFSIRAEVLLCGGG